GELVHRFREQVCLEVAAGRVRGGEEIQHHRPALERRGQVVGERIAGEVGGRRERGRLVAGLQRGQCRGGQQDREGDAAGGQLGQGVHGGLRGLVTARLYANPPGRRLRDVARGGL